jgi:hypothetical protein
MNNLPYIYIGGVLTKFTAENQDAPQIWFWGFYNLRWVNLSLDLDVRLTSKPLNQTHAQTFFFYPFRVLCFFMR